MLPPISIKRSRRRTVSIKIDERNQVTVLAPTHLPQRKIDALIIDKKKWILDKIQDNLSTLVLNPDFNLFESPILSLKGRPYSIHFERTVRKRPSFQLQDDTFTVFYPQTASEMDVSIAFTKWMHAYAKTVILERVALYAPSIPRPYSKIVIRSAKSRWGSCSSTGTLSFSWPLVTTPIDMIDYVVVHELCHLVHMNHSHRFWALVESIYPQASNCRQWLRQHAHILRQYLN